MMKVLQNMKDEDKMYYIGLGKAMIEEDAYDAASIVLNAANSKTWGWISISIATVMAAGDNVVLRSEFYHFLPTDEKVVNYIKAGRADLNLEAIPDNEEPTVATLCVDLSTGKFSQSGEDWACDMLQSVKQELDGTC